MLEQPTRRGLITGLGALFLCAPAVVRASSLMPISARNVLAVVDAGPSIFASEWALAFKYILEKDHDGLERIIVQRIGAAELYATA